MKKENFFYLTLLLTIIFIRISILILPEVDIRFLNVVIHHFWLGVILIMLSLSIQKQKVYIKILVYGIGFGLILDQLIFMILGAGKDKEYWALPSLLGTVIMIVVVFPIRAKLTSFFKNPSSYEKFTNAKA